jgi:hypothetical protein
MEWDKDRRRDWPAGKGITVFNASASQASASRSAFTLPADGPGPAGAAKDPAVVRRASDVLGHVLEFIAATRGELCRNGLAWTEVEMGQLATEFELVGRCAYLVASELRQSGPGPGARSGS